MPAYVDVDALLKHRGWTLLETVKRADDHEVHVVEVSGARLVLKTNTSADLVVGQRREVGAALLLHAIAQVDPHWTVRTSIPLEVGDGWLLREHVDAPPLLEEGNVDRPDRLDRLARALADLDRLAPDPAASRATYRDPASEPRATPEDRKQELARWVDELSERGAVGDLDAVRVLERVRAGVQAVRPGFEVLDVKFDDFLDLPDGSVGLYDLEWAHPFGRRYFDLARLWARLAVDAGAPGAASRLLGSFLQATPLPTGQLAPALLPVLREVLLSSLYAAADEGDDARAARARRLLADALDDDLDRLLDPARE